MVKKPVGKELAVIGKDTSAVALLEQADRLLAEATTIVKAKKLMDIALVVKDWAKIKNQSEKIKKKAHALFVDAEDRLGKLLTKTPLAKGGRPPKTPRPSLEVSDPTLKSLGLTEDKSSEVCQRVANHS